MVLAAGLGTRLRPFTSHTPKALIPLLGVPALEYSLMQLKAFGVQEAVVNTHSFADTMEAYLGQQPVAGLNLIASSERELLLGSAGGFRKALPNLGSGPFVSMNADVVQMVPLADLMERHQKLRAERKVVMTLALLSGDWLKAQSGQYRKLETNEATGLITGYSKQVVPQTPFFTGVAIFEPEAFQHLPLEEPSDFVPAVLEPWIQKRKVGFHFTDSLWMDIGSPELWFRAHFDLYERYRNVALPAAWVDRIRQGLSQMKLDRSAMSVDYDLAASEPLGKMRIRYHNETYAISNLGHP